jgi:hypothetical protein
MYAIPLEQHTTEESAAIKKNEEQKRREEILIVDDEPAITFTLKTVLEENGLKKKLMYRKTLF